MDNQKSAELIDKLLDTCHSAKDLQSAQTAAPAAAALLYQIVQQQSAAPYELLDFLQQELAEMLGF